jgi:prepilin-type N-terminal cleavage/methylation domain-containing protein
MGVIFRKEGGFSLVETIVGLAIISIIGVTFMSGLAISFRGEMVQDKTAFGEAIATSQIEHVKNQPFSTCQWSYTVSASSRSATQQPSWWDVDNPALLDSDFSEYYAVLTAEDFDADGDSTIEVPGDDDSIRKITVSVYNSLDDNVTTIITYKTNR